MKTWTRYLSIVLLFVAGGFMNLRAAEGADPVEIKLKLYQIEAAHTGQPACAEPLAFLREILVKSFPHFDTFKLLFSAEKNLTAQSPALFTSGDYVTQVTLLGFVRGKTDDGKPFWKAKLKLECKTADKVLYNPTIQILPGGQNIWAVDKLIFVLHLPTEDSNQ